MAAAAGKAPADAGANAFGQMATTLGGTNKSASSTGGTTTQTPTGQVHKANPANPNQTAPVTATEPTTAPATEPTAEPQVKAPRQSLKQRLAAKGQGAKESIVITSEPLMEQRNEILESLKDEV